jgi:hypothetical protein
MLRTPTAAIALAEYITNHSVRINADATANSHAPRNWIIFPERKPQLEPHY